jgi:ABC-type transport system substrate-binding protein
VTFHNGEAFDASVAKWNLERAAVPENGNPHPEYFNGIETIETPDSHTIVIRLKAVDALFIAHMAEGDAVMLPMKGYEEAKSNSHWHRSLQIRQMGEGRPGGDGPLRRLLESLFCPTWTG